MTVARKSAIGLPTVCYFAIARGQSQGGCEAKLNVGKTNLTGDGVNVVRCGQFCELDAVLGRATLRPVLTAP